MNSETLLEQQQHKRAKQMIDRFVRRFDPSYRLLARYAALPLVLTPELLNYLRNQFLRSEVPWVAEVDLLLSDLCSLVGYEQYAMDTYVRACLLAEMQQEESGVEQMQDIARLLINYVYHLSLTNPYIRRHELKAQQWAAMVYLNDHRETVAREIAKAFQETTNPTGTNSSLINRAEMARLSRITQELELQLKQSSHLEPLVQFASLISDLMANPSSVESEAFNRSYSVLGIELNVPSELIPNTNPISPQLFKFEVVTVNAQGQIINREQRQANYFTENLGNGVTLEMVAIPGGTFIMGAPKTEEQSTDDERPQHEVTVPPFYMGKYTVTQAQWRVVANLPQVNRELEPDPSRFKGENLPVENVSWYDAEEFCARLSVHTKRHYRLPSEAEWEYACRSRTTTPFHFGETITPELANYDGNYTYGSGAKGEYREKTIPVGSLKIANTFGLFDMHGNVWEWCQDCWHQTYELAPSNGIAWYDLISENDNQMRMLRGGSWYYDARVCRSACRDHDVAAFRGYIIGFRVVLSVART